MANELERAAKLKKLPDYILNALSKSQEHLQLDGLKAQLPEFEEVSDDDWYSVLKDMESDSLIQAHFIRTGIADKIRAAFNIAITVRGRQLTPELPLRGRLNMDEGSSVQVVTLGGECFRTTFGRTEASDRDGVYYLFKVEDLIKNRGQRLVSLFRSGQLKRLRANFDSLIPNARLNAIRRAFDSGEITFEAPFEEHKYQQLTIKPEDFEGGVPKTIAQVKQFIVHKAYWLGYRYNPNPASLEPIQFDVPADLDYLRVSSDDVKRCMWRLSQQGLLNDVLESFGTPAAKLIDEYENDSMAPKISFAGKNEGTSNEELLVFISHSSQDEALAAALIDLLRASIGLLASQIRCSSVDGYRLPVGVNSEEKLRQEVSAAPVVVGLLTPNSLASYFVMFELGARWGGGVRPHDLKQPLSLLNALSADNESQLCQLVTDIAARLEMPLQSSASYMRNVSIVKQLAGKTVTAGTGLNMKRIAGHSYVDGDDEEICSRCAEVDARVVHLLDMNIDGRGMKATCPQCKTAKGGLGPPVRGQKAEETARRIAAKHIPG
jgi:hypothetical protein